MTTIAVRDKEMACDSRVTGGPLGTCPTKIIEGDGVLVGFCGDYVSCYTGAQYLAGLVDEKPESTLAKDTWFLILDAKGIWFADRNLDKAPVCGKFTSIGSGEMAAHAAMIMGATATEAIKIAIKCDEGSGPPVRTFRL